ncbi:MAG: M28 family peptidase [Hyphomicrobium sp.]
MTAIILASLTAAVTAVVAARRFIVFPLRAPRSISTEHHKPTVDHALALRLEDHIRATASVPHHLGVATALDATARAIEARLRDMGLTPRADVFDVEGIAVRNIEVVFEPQAATDCASQQGAVPRASAPTSTVIVGAHYDSIPDCPGANDNGTGVAALLELARAFAQSATPLSARVRLVFFVNEEQPYGKTDAMGALRHARRMRESCEDVRGMIALETLGYFSDAPGSQRLPWPFNWMYGDRGDFVAFIGLPGSSGFLGDCVRAFRAASTFPSVGAVVPAFIEGADLSDHWAYRACGYPALMITDTAPYRNPFYHQPFDTPDTVNYAALAQISVALATMVRQLAETPSAA